MVCDTTMRLSVQNVYQKDYREQVVGAPPAIPENYVSSSPRDLAAVMGGRSSPPPAAFTYDQSGNQSRVCNVYSFSLERGNVQN